MSSIEVIYYDIAGNRVTWPCTQTYLTCVITRYVSIHHLFKVRCNDITKLGGEVRNGILRCCWLYQFQLYALLRFLQKKNYMILGVNNSLKFLQPSQNLRTLMYLKKLFYISSSDQVRIFEELLHQMLVKYSNNWMVTKY